MGTVMVVQDGDQHGRGCVGVQVLVGVLPALGAAGDVRIGDEQMSDVQGPDRNAHRTSLGCQKERMKACCKGYPDG